MLRVSNVSIHYGARTVTRAVEDVSFEVGRNEKLVIVGPSGCGKSTLLTAIAGFLTPVVGTIALNGALVTEPGPERVMVFQDLNQYLPWKTVEGNVRWGIRKRWPAMAKVERGELARHYIDAVGLAGYEDRYPHLLSGGQKQRVALARAFAVKPALLLLDEPFGALDAITREQMQDELNRLWAGADVSIVFVTHDVSEAVRLGHRILVMSTRPGRVSAILTNDALGHGERDDEREAEMAIRVRSALAGDAGAGAVRRGPECDGVHER